MPMTRHPVYTTLAAAVLLLTALPVGIAVFVLGFVYGDSPCVMCWEQRIGMALIALNGLFILRYGPRPRYVGLAVLTAAWGIHMGVRHASLHVARDIGQGFSLEVLGAHTYTWSAFIFWICAVAMGLLLLWLREDETILHPGPFRRIEHVTAGVFVLVVAANIVQAFASTGPPPYLGQGDPVRFSFNPSHWVWSLEEWSPEIPISWRGRWAAAKPSLDGLDPRPASGPLRGTTALAISERHQLSLPLPAPVSDLAYDPGSRRFLLTTANGIYLADESLSHIVRHTVVDTGFSVDLARLVGAAFFDSRTILAVSDNKSYVVLKEAGQADARANFRFFIEAPEQFDHVARSRFTTVRGRLMYVMSAAYDAGAAAIYTITVPNTKNRRFVVSRFDRADMTLSAEFTPRLAPGSSVSLQHGRSLDEYFVTGVAVADGLLYALSAAHATVLAIDPSTQQITGAWTVPGLERPTGLAVRDGQFWVVTDRGEVAVIAR